MPYRGTVNGAVPDKWKRYTPKLVCAQALGDPSHVQPGLGTGYKTLGQYQETLEGFAIVQFYIELGTGATPGTGSAYLVSVPRPANRWTKSSVLPDGADLPIGAARVSQGRAADPSFSMEVIPTLADRFPLPLGRRQENRYVQFFHKGCRAQGQATIAASGTSIAVTTGLNDKVRAEDVTITPTGTASGTNWQYAYVDTFTTTGFTIRTKNQVGTGGQTFAWSIDATPWTDSGDNPSIVPMLVRPDAPWVAAAGYQLKGELFYEIAT